MLHRWREMIDTTKELLFVFSLIVLLLLPVGVSGVLLYCIVEYWGMFGWVERLALIIACWLLFYFGVRDVGKIVMDIARDM